MSYLDDLAFIDRLANPLSWGESRFKQWSQAVDAKTFNTPIPEEVCTMIEVKLNLPELPAGYEYTGEYRVPEAGDKYMLDGAVLDSLIHAVSQSRIIVRQLKWRAEKGEQYYYVGGDLEVASQHDHRHSMDTKYWACDNYFDTRGVADKVAEDWKFVLKRAVEGGKDG